MSLPSEAQAELEDTVAEFFGFIEDRSFKEADALLARLKRSDKDYIADACLRSLSHREREDFNEYLASL